LKFRKSVAALAPMRSASFLTGLYSAYANDVGRIAGACYTPAKPPTL